MQRIYRRVANVVVGVAGLLASSSVIATPGAHLNASLPSRHHRVSTPLDSFLVTKVYSTDELMEQVESHPRVRALYARHFHVSQDKVVDYMRANLVESYVPRTQYYRVYSVHPSGRIYSNRVRFQRGTKVFALRNGQPVLKWVCGNPLVSALPAVETRTITKAAPSDESQQNTKQVAANTEMYTPSDNVDTIVPSETGPNPATDSSSDINGYSNTPPAAPPVTPPVQVAQLPSPPVTHTYTFIPAGGGGGISPLLGLLALPLGYAVIHSNSSGSGGGQNSNVTPTPEASTMAELGLLMAGAGAFVLRKRRSAPHSS